MEPKIKKVTILGSGIVGRSWALVFARGGCDVTLFDSFPQVAKDAPSYVERVAKELYEYDLLRGNKPEDILKRVRVSETLEDALKGAEWVQECVPENVENKKAAFASLDLLAPEYAILASSTSSIPCSFFCSDLKTKHRCLVAHPVNPPHLIPLVEVCPGPFTNPEVTQKARQFLEEIGQSPIVVKKEVESFILNRLQGALLNEAFRLVEDGLISTEDLDKTVKDGLGLRWSFMGPFETIDLNAPGGVQDYVQRYGGNMYKLAKAQADPREWKGKVVEEVTSARRSMLEVEKLPERSKWRDSRLAALMQHKKNLENKEKK